MGHIHVLKSGPKKGESVYRYRVAMRWPKVKAARIARGEQAVSGRHRLCDHKAVNEEFPSCVETYDMLARLGKRMSLRKCCWPCWYKLYPGYSYGTSEDFSVTVKTRITDGGVLE